MGTSIRSSVSLQSGTTLFVAVIVLAAAGSPYLKAQNVPITPEERRIAQQQGEKLAATWTKRLEEADGLIRSGNGKKAVKISKLLARDMMDKILFGESAGQWLGTTCLLRALGHAQEGDEARAIWYWHVAQQLLPAIASYDLAPYGASAELLRSNPLRPESFAALPRTSTKASGEISRPKEVFAPTAAYPRAQRDTRLEPFVHIETRVGDDGSLSHPLVVGDERRVPFVFTALDQIRNWKVKPATRDGQPLTVLHEFVIQVR